MSKVNKELQSLKRSLYREIISRPEEAADVLKHGVSGVLARLHFLQTSSDYNAVDIVVEQFNHEISKLQQKGISRKSWPKFLQDEDWKQKTYTRFGVPYPGTVIEITPIPNNPIPQEEPKAEIPQATKAHGEPVYFGDPCENDGFGSVAGTELENEPDFMKRGLKIYEG